MTQRVVIVSDTPLWVKIIAVIAVLVLIKFAIVAAIFLGLAFAFYKVAPGLCQILIVIGVIYLM